MLIQENKSIADVHMLTKYLLRYVFKLVKFKFECTKMVMTGEEILF